MIWGSPLEMFITWRRFAIAWLKAVRIHEVVNGQRHALSNSIVDQENLPSILRIQWVKFHASDNQSFQLL